MPIRLANSFVSMQDMRILLVEDEPKVAAFISQGLRESGCQVDVAYDGGQGRKLAMSGDHDAIILDVILPGMSGLELCRSIRQGGSSAPILMLSALGTTDDKVSGLDHGADDYLVKPFEFKELKARLRSLVRRLPEHRSERHRLVYADLELDMERKEAVRQGKRVALTPKEYALLEYLMRNAEKVVTRAQISEHVWNIDFDTGTNVVDVYVKLLRKKMDKDMGPKLIHTRVGLGYILTRAE
jgi:two-component system, OmpR family, copper resistance phosphate regulon response regulator CusR